MTGVQTCALPIYLMGLMIALGEIGLDLGPLLAGAGIVGLAIGFGAQSLVSDFIAGIFVIIGAILL